MWKGLGMLAFVCAFAFPASADDHDYMTAPIIWVGTKDTWDLPKQGPMPYCVSEIRRVGPSEYILTRSVCEPFKYSDRYYTTVWQNLDIPNPPPPAAHLENQKIVFDYQ